MSRQDQLLDEFKSALQRLQQLKHQLIGKPIRNSFGMRICQADEFATKMSRRYQLTGNISPMDFERFVNDVTWLTANAAEYMQ